MEPWCWRTPVGSIGPLAWNHGGPRAWPTQCFGPAANALFYQFGSAVDTFEALANAALAGLLSSLIVFVPTTILSFLFRRVRRRDFFGQGFEELSKQDLAYMSIDVRSSD